MRQVIGGGTGERRRLRTGDTENDYHEGGEDREDGEIDEDDLNRCLTQFDAFSRLSEPILLSQWSFVSHRNSLTHISVHFAIGAEKERERLSFQTFLHFFCILPRSPLT